MKCSLLKSFFSAARFVPSSTLGCMNAAKSESNVSESTGGSGSAAAGAPAAGLVTADCAGIAAASPETIAAEACVATGMAGDASAAAGAA